MSELKIWILALLLFPSLALAQDVVQVNSMNYPAWAEREDRILPLRPGSVLQAQDRVHTGDGGRVLLQFSDGSAVKLGESLNSKSKWPAKTAIEACYRPLSTWFAALSALPPRFFAVPISDIRSTFESVR